MGRPPPSRGAVHDSVAVRGPRRRPMSVGVPGTVAVGTGVTAERDTMVREPAALVALTRMKYDLAVSRFLNATEVPAGSDCLGSVDPAGMASATIVVGKPPSTPARRRWGPTANPRPTNPTNGE